MRLGTREELDQALRDREMGVMWSPDAYLELLKRISDEAIIGVILHNPPRPTHAELVRALAKSGDDILKTMNGTKMHLLHMAVGMAGEGGEMLDVIKKIAIYNKTFTKEHETNILEELGDCLFYMQGIMQSFGWTIEDVQNANIDKLLVRYKGMKYTDDAAQQRADKA